MNKKAEEVLTLVTDVKHLRQFIIPINNIKKTKNIIDKHFFRQCCKLLEKYDTAFEYVYSNANYNEQAYYDRDEFKIVFYAMKYTSLKYKYKIFAHELAHRIQHIEEIKHLKSKAVIFDKLNNIDDMIKYERTAERLAYFICKEYFPWFIWNHSYFSMYKSKIDITFLKNYYKVR